MRPCRKRGPGTVTLDEAVALIEVKAKDGKPRQRQEPARRGNRPRRPRRRRRPGAGQEAAAKKPAAKKPAKKPAAKTPAKRQAPSCGCQIAKLGVNRKPAAKPKQKPAPPTLPSEAAILEFVAAAPGKVGKREIARAFNIRGDQRAALKELLKQLAADGKLERRSRRLTGPVRCRPSP